MRRAWLALRFVLALAVLQFVALVPLPFHADGLARSLLQVSPDLILVVALACVGTAAARPWLGAFAGALVLVAVMTFRLGEFVVLASFDRPFELSDLKQLPGVFHLLWSKYSSTTQDWWLVATIGVYALFTAMLTVALRRVASIARGPRAAVVTIAVLQALVVVLVARSAVSPGRTSARFVSTGAMAETCRTAIDWLHPGPVEGPILASLRDGKERMAALPDHPKGLDGTDVHLLVVESYGRAALREPTLAPALRRRWQELAQELERAGWHGVVGACAPSIRGGASWLAHAEFFSGVRIDKDRARDLLLASDLTPLPAKLAAGGRHTVEVLPAMSCHWPEGQKFFGFAEALTQLELGYTGTRYPFGLMPDQYALHRLLEDVVRPAKKPLFTCFVSTTSHAPWQEIPPYVADWSIRGDTFAAPPLRSHPVGFLGVPHDPGLVAQYGDSLDYALRAAVGFVCRLPRPSLVILVGDHQPPIARAMTPPDYTFDVPLHVFSNRPELLAPWRELGLVDGVDLAEGVPSFPMADVAPAFLRLYAK